MNAISLTGRGLLFDGETTARFAGSSKARIWRLSSTRCSTRFLPTRWLPPGLVPAFDDRLGDFVLTGLRGGVVREQEVRRGGFQVLVGGQ